MIRSALYPISIVALAVILSACGTESSGGTSAEVRSVKEASQPSFCIGSDRNVNSGLVQY